MQLKRDLEFLTARFPLMARTDQLMVLGLVNSRAMANQASEGLLSAKRAASRIADRPLGLDSL